MISTLQAFLIQAAKEQTEQQITVSKRIEYPFKIRALSMDEWERIQKLSTDPETHRVDNIGMLRRTAIEGCLDPNYKDAEFIKAIGANTPDEALKKTLKAGEIVKLANAVLKFSGFGESVEEARQEAQD